VAERDGYRFAAVHARTRPVSALGHCGLRANQPVRVTPMPVAGRHGANLVTHALSQRARARVRPEGFEAHAQDVGQVGGVLEGVSNDPAVGERHSRRRAAMDIPDECRAFERPLTVELCEPPKGVLVRPMAAAYGISIPGVHAGLSLLGWTYLSTGP
jgi:hypothetical protein